MDDEEDEVDELLVLASEGAGDGGLSARDCSSCGVGFGAISSKTDSSCAGEVSFVGVVERSKIPVF